MKWPLFLSKERWRLVKTIEHPTRVEKDNCVFYFHLHESNKGSRKCVLATTLSSNKARDLYFLAKQMDIYQNKIYKWTNGRYDPDIPSYNQIPEEETVNALKGRID